jgi:predicted ATPase/transcriptional regulator with XRE-family HTH domain
MRLRQAELARMAACAEVTLRKIEADERRPSSQLAEALANHLTLSPEESLLFLRVAVGERRVWDLPEPALPDVPRGLSIPRPKCDNLPTPPTQLVGRDMELATLSDALSRQEVRLLTLTGAPGIGKTRLAIEVAIQARDAGSYADGVWFVPLAAITNPALLIPTIAQTLSQSIGASINPDALKHDLGERHLLILLDNLEQLLDAASEIADLLAHVPKLTVLATSRAPLHVLAEHVYAVPPLLYPDKNSELSGDESRYPAVMLFSQRAKAAQYNFALNEQNVSDVSEICRRLGGLPLAIELAAARIRLFNPRSLLAQLTSANGAQTGGSLDLLAAGTRDLPARQQTLRNAIAWSYALLTPSQQRLLRLMSVFAGGCTLEAARFVAGHLPAFLSDLHALLDHSLIQQQETDGIEPRYSLLEMVREFANEELARHDEVQWAHERQLDYFIALLNGEPAYDGVLPEHAGVWPGYISLMRHDHFVTGSRWTARLIPERENLLAGLQWSLKEGRSPQRGVQLVLSMYQVWWNFSLGNEPERWILLALKHVPDIVPDTRRGRLLCEWARVLLNQGRVAKARNLAQQSLDIHRLLEEDMDILCALHALAEVEIGLGLDEAAHVHLNECIDMALEMKKERYAGWAMFLLGRIAVQHRDFEAAQRAFDRSLAHFPHEDERDVVALYHEIGMIACVCGEFDHAVAMHAKSLNLWKSTSAFGLVAMAQCGLGDVALFRGDLAQARSIFEESLTLSLESGRQMRMMHTLYGLAAVLAAKGQYQHAVVLWAAAESAHSALGNPRRPFRYDDYQTFIGKARNQLGPAVMSQAKAHGQAMALESAVQYALGINQSL